MKRFAVWPGTDMRRARMRVERLDDQGRRFQPPHRGRAVRREGRPFRSSHRPALQDAYLADFHKNDRGLRPFSGAVTNTRFWKNDFVQKENEAAVQAAVAPLMALVRPAIEQLEACKKDAAMNADLLDAFLYAPAGLN